MGGDETQGELQAGTRDAVRRKLGGLPRSPGVYIFRNTTGKIIYIGKAKVLANRVRSYFQTNYDDGRPHIHALVHSIADLEFIATQSETEALVLEANLVRKHAPRYNVRLKDDKKYPYLVITNEDFPRIEVTRTLDRKSGRYFGPYTDVRALRRTVELLHRIFQIRTCHPPLPSPTITRPCLQYEIKRCKAPCVGLQSREDYAHVVGQAERFIRGQVGGIMEELRAGMEKAAGDLQFERAAELRDRLRDIETTREKQALIDPLCADRDIVALARDDTEAVAVVLEVREGKLAGRKDYSLTVGLDESEAEIVAAFLRQYYLEAMSVPREVAVPEELDDHEAMEDLLSDRRAELTRNGRVKLVVPRRGERVQLVEMARKNAELLLFERRSRREKMRDRIPHDVVALQRDLFLKKTPRRIVCFDISHMQGTDVVASMVVFQDGKPYRKSYRHFQVRTLTGEVGESDDFASMREVIGRQLRHFAEDADQPVPDLLVVDGGKGQLSSAKAVLDEKGFADLAVIGLAKRLEEVFVPGQSEPLTVPRTSSGLKLLQRLRDEAHRVAISYHRQKRGKSMKASALDEVEGIGEKRKQALLKRFRSVANLLAASAEEMAEVPGIGPALAEHIHAALRATGEPEANEANQ